MENPNRESPEQPGFRELTRTERVSLVGAGAIAGTCGLYEISSPVGLAALISGGLVAGGAVAHNFFKR